MLQYKIVILVLFITTLQSIYCQGIYKKVNFCISKKDSVLKLPNDCILLNSIKLTKENEYELSNPLDFDINYKNGIIIFSKFFRDIRVLDDKRNDDSFCLTINYNYVNFNIENSYQIIKPVAKTITRNNDTNGAFNEIKLSNSNNYFGKDFKRSGSIIRGLTIGTNRDLTLQSGLKIQFSGNISDNVDVLGVLSDEQTPIQPEGTSQTIKEIDNIFIEFKSPIVNAVIGKFSTELNNQGKLDKRLQGVKTSFNYLSGSKSTIVAGISPGERNFQIIQGRESDQGPYKLFNAKGENKLVVIAGSEKIFLDGLLLTRGVNNDYIIDYSNGEVFFQPKKLITSNNRIEIDFEYINQNYSKSYLEINNTNLLFDSTLKFNINYKREAEDQDSPIDLVLSEEDKNLISNSIGNNLGVKKSGEKYIGRSDTLKGNYYKKDTLINNERKIIYVFDILNNQSIYDVTFTDLGYWNGSYKNISFGNFEYVGFGLGNYEPIVYLPIPKLLQTGNIGVELNIKKDFNLSVNLLSSYLNENRFNNSDSNKYNGIGYNLNYKQRINRIFSSESELYLNGNYSFQNDKYINNNNLIDVNSIQKWGGEINKRIKIGNLEIGETEVLLKLFNGLDIKNILGFLKLGETFNSFRQYYELNYDNKMINFNTKYKFENIVFDSNFVDTKGVMNKHQISFYKNFSNFNFGAEITNENKIITNLKSDVNKLGGYNIISVEPFVKLNNKNIILDLRLNVKSEDSTRLQNNKYELTNDSKNLTLVLSSDYNTTNDLRTKTQIGYRYKKYDESLKYIIERKDIQSILIKSESFINLYNNITINGYYEANTEQTGRLERQFIRVPFGQGSYIWNDFNENKIQEESEFIPTNNNDGEYLRIDFRTEKLYPIIDLKAQLRIKEAFKNNGKNETFFEKIISKFSGETIIKLEEKSTDEIVSNIYLLKLSKFQNDSNTILGNSYIQQDLNILENDDIFSSRIRYSIRKNVVKLIYNTENSFNKEWNFKFNFTATTDIKIQTMLSLYNSYLKYQDTTNFNNNLISKSFEISGFKIENDFTYSAIKNLELGWKIKSSIVNDLITEKNRKVNLIANNLRGIYSLSTNGRIRCELEITSLESNVNSSELLPYQLTDGYYQGLSWLALINFDYRIGLNLQLNINYSGRSIPPTNKVIHTGQAEIRAFF